jgi:hypothetical protein
MKPVKKDTKKLFFKKGTCSQTFFYLINREFDNNNEVHEKASDPLVGGILQLGHQCGLLIGSSLAVGREAHRRYGNTGQAVGISITASRNVLDAFSESAGSPNCRDITDTDFSKKLQFARYMVFKAFSCFKLADKWTENALESTRKSLNDQEEHSPDTVSCASELARMMGANEEEIGAVSGLAGGIGLSGEACGALIAAIWLNSIKWVKENPGKSAYSNQYASNVLFTFDDATGSKFLCREICGREFESIEDHSTYIREGGCSKLIEILSQSW